MQSLLQPQFKSKTMEFRNEKLKTAKSNVIRCQRDLKRDRTQLDKKEKSLMIQLKNFASKGDLVKAKMIARQIALYRRISDKNFERDLSMDLQVRTMTSNHKIHKAQIECLRGIQFTTAGSFAQDMMRKDQKYIELAQVQQDIESILLAGMDEIYGIQESNATTEKETLDSEVNVIMRQALDTRLGKSIPRTWSDLMPPGIQLHIRVHQAHLNPDRNSESALLTVPTVIIF